MNYNTNYIGEGWHQRSRSLGQLGRALPVSTSGKPMMPPADRIPVNAPTRSGV